MCDLDGCGSHNDLPPIVIPDEQRRAKLSEYPGKSVEIRHLAQSKINKSTVTLPHYPRTQPDRYGQVACKQHVCCVVIAFECISKQSNNWTRVQTIEQS